MITIDTTPGMCTCACGLRTSKTASFRPGHDAKLKGALKRGERTREPIVWVRGSLDLVDALVQSLRPVAPVDRGPHTADLVFDDGMWVVCDRAGTELYRSTFGYRCGEYAKEHGLVFPPYDPRSHAIPGRDELHRKAR